MKEIHKILIANRGEIAVRIIRTCRKLGKKVTVVYSKDDADSLAVQLADEAYHMSGSTLQETYLNIDQIIQIAKTNKIGAIHPGYGFLSENAAFAKACEKNNIIFIGPVSSVIELMGDKVKSKKLAQNAGVPVLEPSIGTIDQLTKKSASFSYPILIKAAAGGGGKGMRIVYKKVELHEALKSTSREAKNYFGDERVFIEKYIENPRHIEVQVLADQHGNVVALFERECSLQRRHQKIIEEAPSPSLNNKKREELLTLAKKLIRESNYTNAGTIEFLADENLNFYFLEMNTRIQVEHPVTEMITGVDIVEKQIKIAEGKALSLKQEDLSMNGNAIEARVYAEDPQNKFFPSPGFIHYYKEPGKSSGLRIDSSINKASIIRDDYDPMISKVIAHGKTRDAAFRNLSDGLRDYQIHGIQTNLSFLIGLLNNKNYRDNKVHTHFIGDLLEDLLTENIKKKSLVPKEILIAVFLLSNKKRNNTDSAWNEIGYWRIHRQRSILIDGKSLDIEDVNFIDSHLEFSYLKKQVAIGYQIKSENSILISFKSKSYLATYSQNQLHQVFIQMFGNTFILEDKYNLFTKKINREQSHPSRSFDGNITAPMPGKVIEVNVKKGDKVSPNTKLLVLEAMKMENQISAPVEGKIKELTIKKGDRVESGQQLIQIELLKTHQTNHQKKYDT